MFCELKVAAPGPQPSRLAREAVPGADKPSRDAGGGVELVMARTRSGLVQIEKVEVPARSARVPSDDATMNTPPATRPAAVVTPTLQQLPRLDAILGCEEAHAPAMPAIDWSTAREAPYTPSMDVPRHGTDDARRRRKNFARRRSSGPADATPSSVMHVIARGSSDQWKTFASSPLMAAAMLIDGAVDEIYDE